MTIKHCDFNDFFLNINLKNLGLVMTKKINVNKMNKLFLFTLAILL